MLLAFDRMNQPTIDELFPILARIESVPLAECQAAYDRLDEKSPGREMDDLNRWAPVMLTTRNVLNRIWGGRVPTKYKPEQYSELILAIEYVIRREKINP